MYVVVQDLLKCRHGVAPAPAPVLRQGARHRGAGRRLDLLHHRVRRRHEERIPVYAVGADLKRSRRRLGDADRAAFRLGDGEEAVIDRGSGVRRDEDIRRRRRVRLGKVAVKDAVRNRDIALRAVERRCNIVCEGAVLNPRLVGGAAERHLQDACAATVVADEAATPEDAASAGAADVDRPFRIMPVERATVDRGARVVDVKRCHAGAGAVEAAHHVVGDERAAVDVRAAAEAADVEPAAKATVAGAGVADAAADNVRLEATVDHRRLRATVAVETCTAAAILVADIGVPLAVPVAVAYRAAVEDAVRERQVAGGGGLLQPSILTAEELD